MLFALIQIIELLINLLVVLVIVQFILGLLIQFNVVSMSNQFVGALYQSLNMLLDPVLKPIQRILPDTGMLDFSAIVLIVSLRILLILLQGLEANLAGVA
jgi:YggT family protein